MDGWWMDMDGVGVNVLKLDIIIILLLLSTSHALRMQTTAKYQDRQIPCLSFPLKLIGADHGLHTSGGVQISCFSEMLTLEGLGGLVPTLKSGSEMESTLHYANSDDAREGRVFTRQSSARLTL